MRAQPFVCISWCLVYNIECSPLLQQATAKTDVDEDLGEPISGIVVTDSLRAERSDEMIIKVCGSLLTALLIVHRYSRASCSDYKLLIRLLLFSLSIPSTPDCNQVHGHESHCLDATYFVLVQTFYRGVLLHIN
jgi:hypothetical protein